MENTQKSFSISVKGLVAYLPIEDEDRKKVIGRDVGCILIT